MLKSKFVHWTSGLREILTWVSYCSILTTILVLMGSIIVVYSILLPKKSDRFLLCSRSYWQQWMKYNFNYMLRPNSIGSSPKIFLQGCLYQVAVQVLKQKWKQVLIPIFTLLFSPLPRENFVILFSPTHMLLLSFLKNQFVEGAVRKRDGLCWGFVSSLWFLWNI